MTVIKYMNVGKMAPKTDRATENILVILKLGVKVSKDKEIPLCSFQLSFGRTEKARQGAFFMRPTLNH